MSAQGTEPGQLPATLSQRELRNNSGAVLRAVAAGESFVITNDGVPVARLIPTDAAMPRYDLPLSRPARRKGGWSDIAKLATPSEVSVAEILDDLRKEWHEE